ncbi:MAG: branched-chain amino acid transport system permease protein, partial [Glaciecola sp.]
MTTTLLKKNALALSGLLAAGYIPLMLSSTQLSSLTLVIAYSIALLSLNVLLGSAGQISLGQFAFVGTGAFLTLQLGARGWPQPVAILVGALGVAAIAALVGLPSLRIKGLAVGIATLVYGIAAEKYLFAQTWFNGSDKGLGVEVAFLHEDAFANYLVAFAFLVLVLLMDRALRDSKLGRAFVVTRDGEERAVAFGVEPGFSKLRAYALSGFIAGIAGGIILYLGGQASAGDFTVLQ